MFVAGFMGSPSMNFIKTMVVGRGTESIIKVVALQQIKSTIFVAAQSMRDQDGKGW